MWLLTPLSLATKKLNCYAGFLLMTIQTFPCHQTSQIFANPKDTSESPPHCLPLFQVIFLITLFRQKLVLLLLQTPLSISPLLRSLHLKSQPLSSPWLTKTATSHALPSVTISIGISNHLDPPVRQVQGKETMDIVPSTMTMVLPLMRMTKTMVIQRPRTLDHHLDLVGDLTRKQLSNITA